MAVEDKGIQFLTAGAAPWIVYPVPFNGETSATVELPADFHRSFALSRKPGKAELEWRCFRQGQVVINGQPVPSTQANNWKRFTRVDVTSLLREGTNDMELIASAATGPPAISARLRADDLTILSDDDWDVSEVGALRLPARLATAEPENIPGNESGGTIAAFRRVWGWECLFLGISLAAAWAMRRFFNAWAIGGILAVAWMVLLAHNLSLVRFCAGFDASAHVQYIDFILRTGKLPHANQGWEMFQPPLYYACAAGLLRVIGCAAFSEAGMVALRVLNALAGAANIALIFWGLRLIYPGQIKKPLAGAAFAAFLPCQLYLMHYTTNEVLMAALGTASICLCLKCLQTEPASVRWRVGLGAALGAACATKASAFALLPAVYATLAARLAWRGERGARAWWRELGPVAGLVAICSGWQYWRLWSEFGNPLAGLWTAGGRHPWWQQSGYLTGRYFWDFGRALTAPYFAGYHSFWDSLYGTFCGDGLWGGQLQSGRALWNLDFVTVGFVLALPMAAMMVTGAAVAVARWMREPRAEGFLIIGAPATYLLALAVVTLKLPYYDQAKAFYALPALLPLCVFVIDGWTFWAARSRAAATGLLVLAAALWFNNYAAFWIRDDAAPFRLCRAMANYQVGAGDAAADFRSVLDVDPHNATAELYVALLDRQRGQMDQFLADVQRARADHPDDAQICALEADYEARQKNWSEALPLAERAARLAPDDYAVALSWMRFARDNGRDADVVTAGELVLRNRPGLMEVHRAMADALHHLGRTGDAALHAQIASEEKR